MSLYATQERQHSQLTEQASLKIEIERMQATNPLEVCQVMLLWKVWHLARPSFKGTAPRVI
jgi:hypothetical protein